MKATRRETLIGALAVPAAVSVPKLARARSSGPLLLHDPSLEAGRRLAEAHGGEALAIEGDRIRFARAVFARRPALVVGVSRPVDAFLVEEVGREAGYAPISEGAEALRELIAAARPPDLGLVLGWALAPKT